MQNFQKDKSKNNVFFLPEHAMLGNFFTSYSNASLFNDNTLSIM